MLFFSRAGTKFWAVSKIYTVNQGEMKVIRCYEHVQKYEAMDWTSQNSIKSIFCYKIAISWNSGLKLSELVNFNSINDIASSKWENLHLKQRNDKKVTLLLFYPMCEM